MDRRSFERRGWLCAALAPMACVLFLLGRLAGLWEQPSSRIVSVLAGILMAEMAVGTVAPFWWLLTAFRRRQALAPPKALMAANAAAIVISLVFYF